VAASLIYILRGCPQPFAFVAMAGDFVPTLSAKNAEKGGAPRANTFAPRKKQGRSGLLPPLNYADTEC